MGVKIVVLDKEFELDEFDVSKIPDVLTKWELGGVTDPVGQLINWLWGQIQDGLNWLWNQIYGWVGTVRDQIINVVNTVAPSIESFISSALAPISETVSNILGVVNGVQSFITGAIASLQSAISSIGANLSSAIALIQSIPSYIESRLNEVVQFVDSIRTTLLSSIESVPSQIEGIIQSIIGYLQNIPSMIEQIESVIVQNVQTGISQISYSIGSILPSINELLHEFYASISGIVKNILDTLVGKITDMFKVIEGGFGSLKEALARIGATFTGFVNPLVEIKNWLVEKITGFWHDLVKAVSQIPSFLGSIVDNVKKLPSALGDIAKKIGDALSSIAKIPEGIGKALTKPFADLGKAINGIAKSLSFLSPEGFLKFLSEIEKKVGNVGMAVFNALQSVGSAIYTAIKGFYGWLKSTAEGVVDWLFGQFSSLAIAPITTGLTKLSEKIKQLTEAKGEFDAVSFITGVFAEEVAKNQALLKAMEEAGESLGDQEVSIEPVGIGAKIRLKLGKILKAVPEALSDVLKDFARATVFSYTFWMLEPTKYYVHYALRNVLPVELPSVHEMIEMTQRSIPTEKFKDYLSKLKDVMAMRGYADWVIDTTTLPPDAYHVKVKDRFGKDRIIPLAMLYEIPTGSELCSMMIHDIFASFDDFKHVMESRGYYPDITKMFYLLHYKYPSLSDLWTFVCRCASGMAWVTTKPVTIEDLGYPDAKSPASFNVPNITPENVKETLNKFIDNYLKYYAKWHDYAPFSWLPNWTADNLIILDLMVDIPQRIDARWMYKWGLIDDYGLFKVVVARGYHPDWVKTITQAECLNALAEERTYARTGIMELARYGFMTLDSVKKILSHLADVEVLGEKVPVKFLDSEVALLTLRAEYDRYYQILRHLLDNVVHAYVWNVISLDTAVNIVKQSANALKLPFELDDTYIHDYIASFTIRREYEIVQRIRSWIRTLVWRATTLAESGVDPEKYIDEYSKEAKLSDAEVKLIKDLVKLFIEARRTHYEVDAIINKLKRGVITTDEAINELVKLGIDKDMAKAIVDAKAKIYTISPSTMVSMMDYIPIDEKWFMGKLEAIGMPEDERKLYYAYAYARMIRSEFMKEVYAILQEFEDGLISESDARKLLKQLATLNGNVKRLLGVDWVILNDDEINFLIEAYKIKRQIKESRERYKSSRRRRR